MFVDIEVPTSLFWIDLLHSSTDTPNAPLHMKGLVCERVQNLFVWIISMFGAQIHHLDVFGKPDPFSLMLKRPFLQYPVSYLELYKLQITHIMPSGNHNLSLFSNSIPFWLHISTLGSILTLKALDYAIYTFCRRFNFGVITKAELE